MAPKNSYSLRTGAWLRNDKARALRVRGVDESGVELSSVLEDLAEAENYEKWILSMVHDVLGDAVLEVGAGQGNLTRRLIGCRTVTAVEPHLDLFTKLEERVGDHPDVTTIKGSLASLGANSEYDSALMVNVLEHIEDDVEALRHMRDAVRPGGHVIVFSPAFEMLYSDFDSSIGHVRRYSKASIARNFESANLKMVENRYVNFPGFFGWLLIARWLKRNPTNQKRVDTYDRRVIPWVRKVEDRISVPLGLSVLTIGQRVEAD